MLSSLSSAVIDMSRLEIAVYCMQMSGIRGTLKGVSAPMIILVLNKLSNWLSRAAVKSAWFVEGSSKE